MPSIEEIGSQRDLHSYDKRQITLKWPFLVGVRLNNLVYAATSEDMRTDRSELTASLIAHMPLQPQPLTEMLNSYKAIKVADFTPEVDDMRVSDNQKDWALHAAEIQVTGVRLPIPVHERLSLMVKVVNECAEEKRITNIMNLTSALVVGATTDGPALEGLIDTYRGITVGEFDPTAENPLVQPTS